MDVKILRWPAEREEREFWQTLGVPRILVLEGLRTRPPVCLDALEDWVRPPVHPGDVQARIATLRARSAQVSAPTVDENGVVHYGGCAQSLSPSEARLMEVLVRKFNAVVDRDELIRCGWPGGDQPRRNALDLQVLRLRRRLTSVGLSIRTAWKRGYMLLPERGTSSTSGCCDKCGREDVAVASYRRLNANTLDDAGM